MKKNKFSFFSSALAAVALGSALSGAAFADDSVNTTGLAVDDKTVTVGILHSISGTMALSEAGSVQAEKLAISQINAAGGVLGRQIKIIQEDGASDWPTYAEKAQKLIVNDKVAAVFGCWTSASRKAVLPVFEQYNNMLFYPTFYEGLEESPNVIYTGQEATQQILAGLDWVMKEKGAKTFYLIGSDYIWPRTSFKIARKHIEKNGGKVVGEEYYPLGHTQFNSVINKFKLKKPDVIFSIVVGGSNVAFYKQLKAAGIDLKKEKPMLLSTSVTEDEVLGIGGENYEGAYSVTKYFESMQNEANKKFVAEFKKMWGDKIVIGDVTESAYLGPWLWKAAVEKAGSFDIDAIKKTLPGVEFADAPNGPVKVHKNHHLYMKTVIGQGQADGQFKVVYQSDVIEPNPFPEGYQ